MTQYWYEGFQAFIDGKSLNDCPYDSRLDPYVVLEWEEGYVESQNEHDGNLDNYYEEYKCD